jgi:hypothetical protein
MGLFDCLGLCLGGTPHLGRNVPETGTPKGNWHHLKKKKKGKRKKKKEEEKVDDKMETLFFALNFSK